MKNKVSWSHVENSRKIPTSLQICSKMGHTFLSFFVFFARKMLFTNCNKKNFEDECAIKIVESGDAFRLSDDPEDG